MQSPFEFQFKVYGYGVNNGYATLGKFNGIGSPASGPNVGIDDCEITVKITYPTDVNWLGS